MRHVGNVRLTGSIVKRDDRTAGNTGTTITSLTIAASTKPANGDSRGSTFYQMVQVFGKYADFMSPNLQVGQVVSVLGTLNFREYENKAGQKRSSLDVNVDSIVPLDGEFETVTDGKGQARLADGINHTTLIGNLTSDPELRYTPDGKAVCNLRVAVNRRQGDKESTAFINAVAWEDLAEQAAKLTKGQPVMIDGYLENNTWTDRDGNNRYDTQVRAFRLNGLIKPGASSDAAQPAQQAQSQPAQAQAQASQPAPAQEPPLEESMDLPF